MCENIIWSFSFITLQKILFRFGGALQKKLLYERSRTNPLNLEENLLKSKSRNKPLRRNINSKKKVLRQFFVCDT